MCPSSSQSSSDLSSPNETCYSFVRRALAKLSNSKNWDDPRQGCRPYWFNQQPEQSSGSIHGTVEQQNSVESNENIDDLPIELHDVDTQISDADGDSRRNDPFDSTSTATPQLNRKSKSKSLSDILSLFPVNFFRPRKSSHDSTLGANSKRKSMFVTSDAEKFQNIIKSKSTHSQLTKVEESEDAENVTQMVPIKSRASLSRKTPSSAESRRPRSLIIPGERMLNADDHRNGNTILLEWDLESMEGSLTEKSSNNGARDSSKRLSWPVIQAKPPLFTKQNMQTSLLIGGDPLKNTYDSVNGDSLPDSGVEDLHEKSTSCTWSKVPAKNASLPDSKSYHLPARLRHLFSKHCKTTVKNSNVEEVVKNTLYQNFINHIIEQDYLFPCHSMPELNVDELEELSLETVFKFQNQLHEEFNCEKQWNKENVAIQLRNGYKQRSISADVTSVVSRRKYINLLNHSLSVGCVKRSISMENPASECFLDFVEQERIYCNRITKEDSLQNDTSFDSDDSVASVIAVPITQNKVPSVANSKGSRPGTPDGTRASDTSVDSEDSCISVIAVPLRDLPEFVSEMPETDEYTTEAYTSVGADEPNDGSVDSVTFKGITDQNYVVSQDETDVRTVFPVANSMLNDVMSNCDDVCSIQNDCEKSPESMIHYINKGSSYQDLIFECNSWQGQPDYDLTELDCSDSNTVLQQGDRKLLRKAGSLPEQSEPNKLKIENNLLNHSALSISTDLTLASHLGLDLRRELGKSGSLSSSRSSSTSSVCWEKFLDESYSVKLDNIAIVTAGNNVIQNGKKSKAILKNASQHSCILQKAAAKMNARSFYVKSNSVGNDELMSSKIECENVDDSTNVTELLDGCVIRNCWDSSADESSDLGPADAPISCKGDDDYASTTNTTNDAYSTELTDGTEHFILPPNAEHSQEADSDANDGVSNKPLDTQSNMSDSSDRVCDANQGSHECDDNEFKEAGVQTSFILYPTESDEPGGRSEISTGCSAEQLDELNGNVPSDNLHSTESFITPSLSSGDLLTNGAPVSKADFVNNATQFVKILNVQSVQPLDGGGFGKTKPATLGRLHSHAKADAIDFHEMLPDPGHRYVEQAEDPVCRTPITAIPKNISFFPGDGSPKGSRSTNGGECAGQEKESQLKVDGGDIMVTSTSSSIEKHFGNLEFMPDEEHFCGSNHAVRQASEDEETLRTTATTTSRHLKQDSKCLKSKDQSLSLSTSDDSLQCESDTGGSVTFHRYYHVFREGELDQLIEKYIDNLHIISSFYDHANWCIIAEKVQVWRI